MKLDWGGSKAVKEKNEEVGFELCVSSDMPIPGQGHLWN